MVELKAPNGAVIQASDEAAPTLLAAGFVHVGQRAILEPEPEKPRQAAPKRRTTRKTAKKG